jgi:hypothetical protein
VDVSAVIARSSTKMIAVNYQNDSCQLHYPKRERYYISSLCFEMAHQMTLSTGAGQYSGQKVHKKFKKFCEPQRLMPF